MRAHSRGLAQGTLLAVLVVGLEGCAGLSGGLRGTPDVPRQLSESAGPANARVEFADLENLGSGPTDPNVSVMAAGFDSDDLRAESLLAADRDPRDAEQPSGASPPPDVQIDEYDPWEGFNEKTFEFNRGLDRWVLKPVAKGYRKAMPDRVQQMIGTGFDNIAFVPRLVNSLLQGKFGGAGRELSRFLINSTLGIGGLFDIAKQEFNIQKSNEDAGQTLGVWGVGPGPYLILPFLPPLTVRDAVGYVADGAMAPLNYVLPFMALFGMKGGDTVNDRALNIDLYQGFEESTVEFYSALRNAYLQRRQRLISE